MLAEIFIVVFAYLINRIDNFLILLKGKSIRDFISLISAAVLGSPVKGQPHRSNGAYLH